MPAKGDSFEPGRVTISDSASDASASEAETVNMPKRDEQRPTAEYPEVTRRLAASPVEEDTGTGWPDEDGAAPVVGRRPVLTERGKRKLNLSDEDEEFYERPARRRPGGCLLFLAGVVALILVAGLVTKVAGLWPSFHNPFANKTTDRSQPTLLLSIQDLSRFEAASGNFQVIIDVQKDKAYIPDVVFNDRTLFVAAGSVDAFVDFSKIGQGAIKDSADHKTAEIDLPAPALEPANLDQSKSYVYAEQRGLWNRITSVFTNDPNKMQELYKYGVQKINEAAVQSDLAQRAADNTQKMLEQLLKSLGYTSIKVVFAKP